METVKSLPRKHVRDICEEYYQQYVDDGVESASIWLRANLKDDEVKEFKEVQAEIGKRYGL